MIHSIVIQGYRSARDVRLPLDGLTVVVGENGTGKSNLYRALMLFQHAAAGTLARAISAEGGMESVLWAGDRRKGQSARVRVETHMDDFTYMLELGVPRPDATSVFDLDPEVKSERIELEGAVIAERGSGSAMLRDCDGRPVTYPFVLSPSESVLSQIADPERFPALPALRDRFAGWRFYHHLPTDDRAPARRPMVRVRTPVLAADGHDLASALRTIREVGHDELLQTSVERAFPGSRLGLDGSTITMTMPGLRRVLHAHELSDDTLRYLYLLAALLSPRPPGLLAFNEPETSLHPDLLAPLGELIRSVSVSGQVWLTTHSTELAQAITAQDGVQVVQLDRRDGATTVIGQGLLR